MISQSDPSNPNGMRDSALPPELDQLSHRVIGAAIEVHSHLGPGLREKMYETALICELKRRGIPVEQQVPFHVFYKGEDLGLQVIDVVVASRLIVECKSCASVIERDHSQLVGYLQIGRAHV